MVSKINKILVPIDFSKQSLIALSQSYNLAKEIDAEIVLLYVIEKLSPTMKMFYKGLDEISDAVENNLENLAGYESKKTGLKFSKLVEKGKVYNKIVKVAAKIDATLIVMGTRGGSRTKFIGSNALRVVKTAPCPVITIKGKKHKKGCDKILLPLDLSKQTADKVSMAIEMAKIFKADIYVLSVLLVERNEIKSRIVKQLASVVKAIEKNNLSCVSEIREIKKGEDSLVGVVLNYSKEIEADLVMIMTQQEKDVKEFFIGSRAQTIINKSEIPVLSISPSK